MFTLPVENCVCVFKFYPQDVECGAPLQLYNLQTEFFQRFYIRKLKVVSPIVVGVYGLWQSYYLSVTKVL